MTVRTPFDATGSPATPAGLGRPGASNDIASRHASSLLERDGQARPVSVLLWSDSPAFSHLVSRNLTNRGYAVHDVDAAAPTERPGSAPSTADVVVGDFESPEPELWQWAGRLRASFAATPLVILGHGWPSTPRLHRLQPCVYVRKPFAIDELLIAIADAVIRSTECR
jgi:DNA-binding response OmpR family regulator